MLMLLGPVCQIEIDTGGSEPTSGDSYNVLHAVMLVDVTAVVVEWDPRLLEYKRLTLHYRGNYR